MHWIGPCPVLGCGEGSRSAGRRFADPNFLRTFRWAQSTVERTPRLSIPAQFSIPSPILYTAPCPSPKRPS
jgi:hypothetical protein